MFLYLSLLFSLALAQQPSQVAPRSDVLLAEIHARLATYEARAQAGGEDPKELEQIARLAFESARTSANFDAWSQACASTVAERADADCEGRLRATAQDRKLPLATRATAASILVRRGRKGAADLLAGIVKGLPPKALVSVAAEIAVLPEQQASPLAETLLASPFPKEQAAGCHILSTFDSRDSRSRLADAVEQMPPGSEGWSACSIARGRLGDVPRAIVYGISMHLSGEELLAAADALAANADPRASDIYRQLIRESPPLLQLRTAERVTTVDPSLVSKLIDSRMSASEPEVRAAALVLERHLRRNPGRNVVRALGDASAIVRLRAAEAVVSWGKSAIRDQSPAEAD